MRGPSAAARRARPSTASSRSGHADLRGRRSDRPGNGRRIGSPGSAGTCPSACSRTSSSRRPSTRRTSGSWRAPASASDGSRPGRGMTDSRSRRPARRSSGRWDAAEIDLLICATVTPDMMFPTELRCSPTRSARGMRLPTTCSPAAPASCTPSRRRTGCRGRLARRRSLSAATCSRRSSTGGPLDARPLRRRRRRCRPGAGRARRLPRLRARRRRRRRQTSRCPGAARATSTTRTLRTDERPRGLQFATRVLVSSAEEVLAPCGLRSTTSTSTSRTRQTSGSSTTPRRSWASITTECRR